MPEYELKMLCVSLQKKLSIRVPLLFVNLVGKVILGKKLKEVIRSKNSVMASSLFTSKRFIL